MRRRAAALLPVRVNTLEPLRVIARTGVREALSPNMDYLTPRDLERPSEVRAASLEYHPGAIEACNLIARDLVRPQPQEHSTEDRNVVDRPSAIGPGMTPTAPA